MLSSLPAHPLTIDWVFNYGTEQNEFYFNYGAAVTFCKEGSLGNYFGLVVMVVVLVAE